MKRKGWQTLPLGEVCQVNPKIGAEAPTPETLVSFVPMAAVDEQRGVIAEQETRAYREVAKGYTYFRDNDVLFAKITPCMENGKAAIAHGLTNGIGFGSTEFHVLRPSAAVLPEWIFAFIRRPSFRAVAKANFTGTAGQQRVSTDFIKTVVVPLPPLDEQHRIVRILDEAEALRQLRARADERMAEFIPALFNQMFGDPATNPKGFKLLTLGEACQKITDGVHLTPTYVDEGVPFLRVTDIQNAEIDWSSVKRIPRDEYTEITRRTKPERGDVLYSKNGTIGIAKEITWADDFAHFVSLALLKPDRTLLDSTYLTEFLNTPMALRQALAHSKTGTVTNLHLNEIRKIKVPCPPPTLQREFVARVTEARALQDQQARSRSRLEAGFQALLYRAFAGEL
jgi:restriction endonuclease S subunit